MYPAFRIIVCRLIHVFGYIMVESVRFEIAVTISAVIQV